MAGGAPPRRGTQAAAARVRTESAERRMAGARNQSAALSLPARRHAPPGLHRTGVAGRRNGPGQNHPGHRRLRAAAPAGQSRPRAGRHPGLAEDRMGGADSAVHRPALSTGLWRTRARGWPPTAAPPFFTIVNYEQMLADALDVNARLRPDIVVLDEAQRIKNWSTQNHPGHQTAAQPLCLHPHRHADREPH